MRSLMLAIAGMLLLTPMAWADPVGGAACSRAIVGAHSTSDFVVTLYGDETTLITLRGDGDTDLDLLVYDENDNLVASDTDLSDQCMVSVRPRWTGRFTIRVVNHGSVYNEFIVCAR